jgi:hypothetical protein
MMILNIIMYLWYITYLIAIPFIIYLAFKGKPMTWREFGFFILGVAFGGIPFYWVMQHL